jgi:hypothetical protein
MAVPTWLVISPLTKSLPVRVGGPVGEVAQSVAARHAEFRVRAVVRPQLGPGLEQTGVRPRSGVALSRHKTYLSEDTP